MEPNQSTDFLTEKPHEFLIVGLGASAGGIEALQEFFAHVPEDSHMAYVVILHLSPDHDSQLAEVLQTVTLIPVTQVKEKVTIEPNHIYVVPPNQHLIMEDGFVAPSINLHLEERRAPVDIFFRTLADSHGPRAIGVILSGTGANGSMGLKRIKERGGAVYVQNPREAEFNEMPRNAIATELIDEVLPVAQIPNHILAYRNSQGTVEIAAEAEQRPEAQQQALREIFTQLRQRTGHDFSNYKRPTLMRRIERRINVRHLPDLPSYAAFLGQHVEESQALLKDLLISVTTFFRDKKPFTALEHDVLPVLLRDKTSEDEVRIWVAGCATGEEAYSLAMLAAERTWGIIDAPKVQIFATDIDETAIAVAREGFYTLNDAADVSAERLQRFFTKEGDHYRVIREIREMILFAHHNFLKDPPFSRLDLVSCRNVLIYLNATAQERVMETFHFALKPGGYLFLGSAESVDGASDLYAIVSRENHIYQTRLASLRHYPVPESVPQLQPRQSPAAKTGEAENRSPSRLTFGELHQKLLEQYAPPSLVVNEEYEIVHMSEKAGRFLEFSGGEPTRNLLKLIKPELRLELRSALYQATQRQTATEARNVVWMQQGERQSLTIHVKPVLKEGDPARGFLLVIFEPGKPEQNEETVVLTAHEPIARQLEEELIQTKAQLRQSAEQYEYQAEELKASNEELQAMNEELRSAAEELETSKEELQSINEELRTVNQELKVKIKEISLTSNNLQNLINSADVATIFLDRAFCTRLYTPAARQLFNLIPSDYGRPISDITHRLEYMNLLPDAQTVLEKLMVIEREVATTDGRAFMMRILPYRTTEDRINGVVMTFFDVTERKRAEEALRASEEKYRTIFETIDEGFTIQELLTDQKGNITDLIYQEVNQAYERHSGIKNALGKKASELFPQLEQPWLDAMTHVYKTGEPVRMEGHQADVNRWFTLQYARVGGPGSKLISVVFNDITERKQQEQQQEFLLKLSDALRTEPDADAVANRALQMLAEQLQLDRCFIGEYLLADDRGEFPYQFGNNRVPPLPEEGVRLSHFPNALRIASDETLIITDLQNTEGLTQADKQNLGMLGFGALLVATIRRGEKNPLWAINAVSASPRRWTQSEIKLVEEVAERTWTAMERARAGEALRESEEKFRTLFETIDEGYTLSQVMYDLEGKPTDLRYLEVNSAFARLSGLGADVAGKTARELNPSLETVWLEQVARVAETGQPVRFEDYAAGLHRWLNVHVSRVGANESTVGIIFQDITERKQREERQAFLLKLSDALRAEPNPQAIKEQTVRMLAEHLHADRCWISEVFEQRGFAEVGPEYIRLPDFVPMTGIYQLSDYPETMRQLVTQPIVNEDVADDLRFADSEQKLLAGLSIRALLVAPLRQGKSEVIWALAATTAVPRKWSESERLLLEEVAERAWAAVERSRAEAALRGSEEQFRRALEEAPIPVIMHAEDGEVLQISRSWTELTGYTLEEVPSFDHWLTQAYGQGANQVRSHMQELFKGHARTMNIDFPVLTRKGELRHWSFSASSPGTLRDGRRFIVGMAVDITHRKQAQEQLQQFNTLLEKQVGERTAELKESRDLLQSVFDTTVFGLAVLKAEREENGVIRDFCIRMTNQQLEKLTGRTDLAGKLYGQVYPEIKQTGLFDLMLQVMETGESAQLEYYYGHDGFDAWFSSMFVRMDDGLVATNLDITLRKQAEAENEKHLHLLEQSEEVARMGSWAYDINSGTFTWSEGMYRLFGLPSGTPVGVEISLQYVIEEDRAIAERIVHRLYTEQQPLEETLRIRVNGEVITLKIKATVLRDEAGVPLRMVGVDLDISEIRRLEQENLQMRIEQQNQLLNAILEAQEEERRRISESLHNGVGQILYATKLNLNRIGQLLPSKQGDWQEALEKTVSLLGEAINETRSVSHELVPILLQDYGLDKAIGDFCQRFSGSSIAFTCHGLAERLPDYVETAIYRIAQELVNNIVKHAKATKARIEVTKDEKFIYIEAQDNGKGINIDNRRDTSQPGKGIGLKTIQDRVKLMAGKVEIDSSPGKGTLVTVILPYNQEYSSR